MTDQLFLSVWLNANGRAHPLRQFEKLLRLFPFSQREQPQSTVSILGISMAEAPLLERPMNGPFDVDEVIRLFADYRGDDVAYEVESWWDLWNFDTDWKLAPAAVTLSCFMPAFDNGASDVQSAQEQLRIDFGVDTRFLPRPDVPGSAKMVESNIRSLLRLVHEVDSSLAVDRRKLQTESGENFADRLRMELEQSASG